MGDQLIAIIRDIRQIIGSLEHLVVRTSMTGTPAAFQSPRGPKCTYNYHIEGPTFKCSEQIAKYTALGLNKTLSPNNNVIYTAKWYYFDPQTCSAPPNMNYSTIEILPIPYDRSELQNNNASILLMKTNLVCWSLGQRIMSRIRISMASRLSITRLLIYKSYHVMIRKELFLM